MAIGRKTGGRVAGVPNRATKEIKEIAEKYGPAAIKTLVKIMKEGEGAARVSAANAILDRAYGKARQAVDVSGDMSMQITTITRRILE